MKAIWNVLSILAVANLLAFLGLLGWLAASDRLSMDRLRSMRQALAPTIAAEHVRLEEEKTRAEAEARVAIEKTRLGTPPVTAADRLGLKLEYSDMDRQRADRVRKEIQDLRRALLLEREQFDQDVAAFRAAKAAFEEERRRIAASEGDAQFQKTLVTLEQLKPEKVRATLQPLLDAGQIDQVVAYLDGVQDRTRTKVIDEFIKADPRLAADLLERLRTRGVELRGAPSARNDQPPNVP